MTDALRLYLKDIKHIPLLSADAEKKLAIRSRRGDSKAKKKLIQSNLRLVINIAKRYTHLGMSLADLIEEGNLGLIKAVSKYNPHKGYRFSTYAAWWIRQFITRSIANYTQTVRVPVYMTEILSKWRRKTELLTHRFGRKSTIEEVARHMKIPLHKARKIQDLAIKTTTSLDTPIGDDGSSHVIDIIQDASDSDTRDDIARIMDREDLDKLLSRMSKRERDIISLRYGLKDGITRTLGETAKIFGITRERIRQIEYAALKKMRQYVHIL